MNRSLEKHFLNTRPVDRAQPLSDALRQAGWQVKELPLLELVPIKPTEDDLKTLSKLAEQPVRLIVVVSPTAAQLGIDALAALHIVPNQLKTRWLAVGHGTAKVLSTAGISAEVPAIESSEGMIASAALKDLVTNEWVMVWRGIGGRELVQTCLLARGVRLQVINLYERQLPILSQTLWTNDWLGGGEPKPEVRQSNKTDSFPQHVVLLSSGESWRYWQMLTGEAAMTPWLLVMSQRLMEELSGLTTRMSQIHSLQPEHIIHVLSEIEKNRVEE